MTGTDSFYIRSHFPDPPEPWRSLVVDGLVERPKEFSIEELRLLPQREVIVTLECAGNGRAYLMPAAPGVQWRLGAVGTGVWQGPSLRDVLDLAGPSPDAGEIVFAGLDGDPPDPEGAGRTYERSLAREVCADPHVLLATHLNGSPLPPDHGGPLRLIVPGWYGMASVKWLARISARREPFLGAFQVDDYVIEDEQGVRPCERMAVRAIIVDPVDGATLRGTVPMRGYCWSGQGDVTGVEVSVDGGVTWEATELGPDHGRYCWREWTYAWEPAETGEVTLIARGCDSSGALQPIAQVRNRLGYCNNACVGVTVRVAAYR